MKDYEGLFPTKSEAWNKTKKFDIEPMEMLYATILTSDTVVSQYHDRTNPLSTIDGRCILVTFNEHNYKYVIYNNIKCPTAYAKEIKDEEIYGIFPNISYAKINDIHSTLVMNRIE